MKTTIAGASSGTLADGFMGLGKLAPGEDLNQAFDVILNPQLSATPEPARFGLIAARRLGRLGFKKLKKGTLS
jgi:hypothetical protein